MRNKSRKGFTLIELLVVVAIIGILAAVGVVAYNGYTKSAKKSASASNHASVVKYVAAEIAKCGIESTAFDGWDCSNKSETGITGDDMGPSGAAVAALSDFKNPYDTSGDAVTGSETGGTASSSVGNTVVSNTSSEVTVSTCTSMTGEGDAEACEVKTNTISID
jgi:type IV pilus assembly protein PilA|tara:strand:+ start:1160 stop:1651 length:492 start_codon:yes stop_codon:yes gene_type:complete